MTARELNSFSYFKTQQSILLHDKWCGFNFWWMLHQHIISNYMLYRIFFMFFS